MKKLAAMLLLITAVLLSAAFAEGLLDLPDDLTTIEAEAFYGLQDVSSAVIPEGVTSIGARAFADSSLEQITLPRSLTSVADDAFEGCTDLVARVYKDSYALSYCQSHHVTYRLIDGSNAATAYIMYADDTWNTQYWLDGNDYPGVTASNAEVTGPGTYTVSLGFDHAVPDTAFCSIAITNGENLFHGHFIEVSDIRVNGSSISFDKGYTTTDDGCETRFNIYNEWVTDIPDTARRADGDLEGASPIIVPQEALSGMMSISVTFRFVSKPKVEAYMLFADENWETQYWHDGTAYENVTAHNTAITGAGTYTVSLEFDSPVSGTAFMALEVSPGEAAYPGYCIEITGVKINGTAVSVGKCYTTSDDGIATRCNLYNVWAEELPAGARRADGDLTDASAVIVDADDMVGMSSVSVSFRYVYGEPPAPENEELTEDEIAAIQSADYNARIAVQSESYIFRSYWYDTLYGLDVEDGRYFRQLTGFTESGEAVSRGGSFTDCVISADGSCTVSMTTGSYGFGTDSFFRRLAVSTDIPVPAVNNEILAISDMYVTIGNDEPQECTWIDVDGYVNITAVDEYFIKEQPFPYTMPGPNETVTFTFTVGGLTD